MNKNNKSPKKFQTLNLVKLICLISLLFQIKLQENKIENVTTLFNSNNETKKADLVSVINLTNYNMVRFVDYEFLEFNYLQLFKYFRKKYFNISNFKINYNKKNKEHKLEYNFELYDENKNLINSKNNTKNNFIFECVSKVNKTKKKKAVLIDNKYYKCTEKFNFSKPFIFGIQVSKQKTYLNIFFNSSEILGLYK